VFSRKKAFFKILQRLPTEIVDQIAYYLPFEKGTEVSLYLNKKLNDTFGINGSFLQNKPWNLFANCGNLFRLKWMHFHEVEECTKDAMNNAAWTGHLETLNWLHINRNEGCSTDAMDWAASNGHFEIVKWLHENRREGCTRDTMDWAARSGHFEIVKWFHTNRSEGCSKYAMDSAAMNGQEMNLKRHEKAWGLDQSTIKGRSKG
jgi:hypothetical protein